jgi:hypothetical protein
LRLKYPPTDAGDPDRRETKMTAASIPPTAVIRVSRGNFDQNGFASVEHIVDARNNAEPVGVTFIPIVNYPIAWHI